jgi:hypothetical protein
MLGDFAEPGENIEEQSQVIGDNTDTVPWARRWRRELQAIKSNLLSPNGDLEKLMRHLATARDKKVWQLLGRADTTPFSSLREFYETKEPWGLGISPVDLVERIAKAILTPDERKVLVARLQVPSNSN